MSRLPPSSAQITAGANATGNLSVQAYTPDYHGGLSDSFPVAISAPISATAAARLLDQTTFGPTTDLIQHVQQEGVTAWLSEQFNTPQTVLPQLPAVVPSYCGNIVGDPGSALPSVYCFESEWWQTAITGNDQLRQRVAFALSELFVISGVDFESGQEEQNYANMLAGDAFTNWYKIMGDVTLSPAMGFYLNMLNSQKPTGTLIANENYARENMQLFNIGLNPAQPGRVAAAGRERQSDPRLHRGAGAGLCPGIHRLDLCQPGRLHSHRFQPAARQLLPSVGRRSNRSMTRPEDAVEWDHAARGPERGAGHGQSADQCIRASQCAAVRLPALIQHLVKSDPSPAYISRVAAVFTDNGNGVRGDMQAVLTAIFTDPEARAGDTAPQPSDGHLREPILWMTGAMRGLGYVNVDPNDFWRSLSNLLQAPRRSALRVPGGIQLLPSELRDPGHDVKRARIRAGKHRHRHRPADPGRLSGDQQRNRL